MGRREYYASSARQLNRSTAPERRRTAVVTPMPQRNHEELKRVHKRSPLKAFMVMVVAVLAMLPIVSLIAINARITELNKEIMDLDTEISRVTGDNLRLELEIEGMMSIKNVEDYAITELGMQKLSRNQIEYIQLNQEDKIEVSNNSKSLFDKFGDLLG